MIKCKYKKLIQFLEGSWNHEYFGSLAKLTWSPEGVDESKYARNTSLYQGTDYVYIM